MGTPNWKAVEGATLMAQDKALEHAHQTPVEALPPAIAKALDGVTLPSVPHRPEVPLTPEMRELMRFERSETAAVMRTLAHTTRSIVKNNELIKDLLTGEHPDIGQKTRLEIIEALRANTKALHRSIDELAKESPEAYLTIHTREIREWRRQLRTGRLVHTPYVAETLEELTRECQKGGIVVLHGETGAGKTELAKLAGRAATGKEPILVRGYAGMDSRELFGHMELSAANHIEPSRTPEVIEDAIKKWSERNPEASEEKRRDARRDIIERILHANEVTVSNYVLGAIYQGAKEGKPVILDEFNYIPPPLLAKLNHILATRPGEKIPVQEDGIEPITMKKGFSVIMTGNIDGDDKKRYLSRFNLDPALLDRVRLINYDYLPQATSGCAADHPAKDKQLFAVALCSLLAPRVSSSQDADIKVRLEDRVGSMVLPGGEKTLDALWRLTQLAAVTQRAFAGKISSSDQFAFQKEGTSLELRLDIALSPRRLISMLTDWRDSGFEHPLDHYIEKRLISQVMKRDQRAYLIQLTTKFGFDPEGRNAPQTEPIEVVPGRKVIEAVFGPIPERTRWPDGRHGSETTQMNAAAMLAARAGFTALSEESGGMVSSLASIFGPSGPAKSGK